jgi:hypothetical protein
MQLEAFSHHLSFELDLCVLSSTGFVFPSTIRITMHNFLLYPRCIHILYGQCTSLYSSSVYPPNVYSLTVSNTVTGNFGQSL